MCTPLKVEEKLLGSYLFSIEIYSQAPYREPHHQYVNVNVNVPWVFEDDRFRGVPCHLASSSGLTIVILMLTVDHFEQNKHEK